MQKSSIISITLGFLISSLFSISAMAGDLEWSGVYRIEGYDLKGTELSGHREKSYGLQHLVLRPKITAGDGLTIYGQFDFFNNATYPDSQMGQVFGSGVNTGGPIASGAAGSGSNTLSKNQKAESVSVSQLYLTYAHEYGELIAGRVPLQFGLGMTHNAGRGLFDHWYETRDLVGYKIVMGNMYFLPMIGKASEGALNQSDDLTDYMIQVQYENPDSDIEMGVFYQDRVGGDQASDAPAAGTNAGDVLGGIGSTRNSNINMKIASVYALRDNERFRAGIEATFESGETGVVTAGGDKVELGGFGIATEFEYRPMDSKWKWGLKAGVATGDDPTTDAKFEGFIFNRNYDVAMLMFNHPLGQADFLRTRLITGDVRASGSIDQPDVEAISNVLYLSPSAKYVFSDHWALDNTLTTGWLETNPFADGHKAAKDLGYEWDLSLNFTPRKGVMWINQVGLLFPGGTWKGDGQFESSFSYGIASKAAISF